MKITSLTIGGALAHTAAAGSGTGGRLRKAQAMFHREIKSI
jgi:hypothetical protein